MYLNDIDNNFKPIIYAYVLSVSFETHVNARKYSDLIKLFEVNSTLPFKQNLIFSRAYLLA